MNKIPRPGINDHAALQNLASNKRVRSYREIQPVLATIQQGYKQYKHAQGNAFSINPVVIPASLASHLRAHYTKPPTDLAHIKTLRKTTETRACPMCGSLHSGTLDHFLPQSNHPVFAVFSLNLVPACKCNSSRQTLLTGPNANERILHPYFDNCLAERLIKARFEDLGPVPNVELQLCVDNTHPEYASISFHVRSIVERTGIVQYLIDTWFKLCRNPGSVVRDLQNNPPTLYALRKILIKELDFLDDYHNGKNNWNSIFIAGLLDLDVLRWLFEKLHANGRRKNGPLICI